MSHLHLRETKNDDEMEDTCGTTPGVDVTMMERSGSLSVSVLERQSSSSSWRGEGHVMLYDEMGSTCMKVGAKKSSYFVWTSDGK